SVVMHSPLSHRPQRAQDYHTATAVPAAAPLLLDSYCSPGRLGGTPRRMTPRIAIAMICTLILTPLAAGPGVVAAPHLGAPRFQAAPQLSAPASMAVDLTTGVVLFEDDADSALPPASTAKLLTALTALRVLSIEEQVTIVDADMVEEEFS